MLFHRYKVKLSSEGYKSYKYRFLRYWYWCWLGLFLISQTTPSAEVFYGIIFVWFLEMLVVYLATDNRIFRVVLPWMLFVMTMSLIGTGVRFEFSALTVFGVWHFATLVISLLSPKFSKVRE